MWRRPKLRYRRRTPENNRPSAALSLRLPARDTLAYRTCLGFAGIRRLRRTSGVGSRSSMDHRFPQQIDSDFAGEIDGDVPGHAADASWRRIPVEAATFLAVTPAIRARRRPVLPSDSRARDGATDAWRRRGTRPVHAQGRNDGSSSNNDAIDICALSDRSFRVFGDETLSVSGLALSPLTRHIAPLSKALDAALSMSPGGQKVSHR